MKTLNNTSLMDLADTRNIASNAGSANGLGCLTVNILQDSQSGFYLDTPLIDILNYATENKGAVIAHYDPSKGHYADNVFYLADFANSPYTRYAVFKYDYLTSIYNSLEFKDCYFKVTQPYDPTGFLPEVYEMIQQPSEMVVTLDGSGQTSNYTVKEIYDHAHSGKNVILCHAGHYMLSELNFEDNDYTIAFTRIYGPFTHKNGANYLVFSEYKIVSSDPTAKTFTYSSYDVPLIT